MRERCKKAAKLLNDLGSNQAKLPFIFCPSILSMGSLKANSKLAVRSPLIMSDNNCQFISQAKVTSLRDAVQANPFRNISTTLCQFSRNLKMDLSKMSLEVQKAQKEEDKTRSIAEAVSRSTINMTTKKGHRGTQTESNPCQKCLSNEEKTFESKSCQSRIQNTLEATTQYEDVTGSLSIDLDARTLQTMTRHQQQLLVEFCRAFDVHQDRFGSMDIEAPQRWDHGNDNDRMSYANPENPNTERNQFVSFSPVRDRTRSPVRNHSRSLIRDCSISPPPPSRSRQRSPVRLSRSPFQGQSTSSVRRKITERLGEKVPSPHSLYPEILESPRSSLCAPQMMQYRIPSPVIHRQDRERRRHSPAREFRNRSRTRSRSPPSRFNRSRSRSPKDPFAHRRGRY